MSWIGQSLYNSRPASAEDVAANRLWDSSMGVPQYWGTASQQYGSPQEYDAALQARIGATPGGMATGGAQSNITTQQPQSQSTYAQHNTPPDDPVLRARALQQSYHLQGVDIPLDMLINHDQAAYNAYQGRDRNYGMQRDMEITGQPYWHPTLGSREMAGMSGQAAPPAYNYDRVMMAQQPAPSAGDRDMLQSTWTPQYFSTPPGPASTGQRPTRPAWRPDQPPQQQQPQQWYSPPATGADYSTGIFTGASGQQYNLGRPSLPDSQVTSGFLPYGQSPQSAWNGSLTTSGMQPPSMGGGGQYTRPPDGNPNLLMPGQTAGGLPPKSGGYTPRLGQPMVGQNWTGGQYGGGALPPKNAGYTPRLGGPAAGGGQPFLDAGQAATAQTGYGSPIQQGQWLQQLSGMLPRSGYSQTSITQRMPPQRFVSMNTQRFMF